MAEIVDITHEILVKVQAEVSRLRADIQGLSKASFAHDRHLVEIRKDLLNAEERDIDTAQKMDEILQMLRQIQKRLDLADHHSQ